MGQAVLSLSNFGCGWLSIPFWKQSWENIGDKMWEKCEDVISSRLFLSWLIA
jgi:hypothetical protein